MVFLSPNKCIFTQETLHFLHPKNVPFGTFINTVFPLNIFLCVGLPGRFMGPLRRFMDLLGRAVGLSEGL